MSGLTFMDYDVPSFEEADSGGSGRRRIVSMLDDSGGMASVYLARDERLERQAAVMMPKASHLNEEFAEPCAREAK